ncbi:T9SS C-terminal target domain-containing protein [Mucilaginibacter terrenus]|uniref:T9SS C-terminal target domain-containing protein n=1 Tax=Mucilaginibacter terrenus TaxID=2482727 RepID=A0A3E2NPZ8_9SPHI|nr:MBG domain-containing protein [Mucilaginibacter terrenus]RFZ83001.1 T9SS C-terminal target domain-containing protein [Mucilaginibacter terrenus]
MGKLYLLCFLALILVAGQSYAQAPQISYPATAKFNVGAKITPFTVTSTGGAVPNERYSKVTTIAGDGFYGYKDTTVALAARFASPVNGTIDKSGNIYVADANLNVIRKISKNGVVSVLAGNPKAKPGALNGQDTAARFNYPTGVAVDSKGNVFVADRGNNMIRKITPTGLVTTFAGSVNDGDKDKVYGTDAKFNLPYSLVVDFNDYMYVADSYNDKIKRITPDGYVATIAGTGAHGYSDGGAVTTASFKIPYSIAVDKNHDLYIADQNNNSIRKFTASTNQVTTLTDTLNKEPYSVAVDDLGRLYMTNTKTFSILQFGPDGKQIGDIPFSGGSYRKIADGTDTLSSYRGSMGLFYDGADNMIVTEPYGSVVRKVAVHGYTITPHLPRGLELDGNGSITGTPEVVSPATRYTITAYNSKGSASTVVTLEVAIGTQTITFDKLPAKTYGDTDFPPGAISTDTLIKIRYTSSNPAVATILKDSVIHIVGAGTTTITASQPGNINYLPATPVSQDLVVNKAPLTVKAVDVIRTDGFDNPELPVSYTGFVNNETVAILTKQATTQTTAVKTSAVADYPIQVSGAEAANYSFEYVPGKLTVFPIPTITAQGSTSIVKGGFVLLKASPNKGGYTYQWTFNGIPIPGATDSTYAAKETGGYNVSLSARNYTTYSLYINVFAQLKLAPDNFKLQLNSVSCKGSNNGSIFISTKQKLKYTVVISGNNLNNPIQFTDTLTIRNLSPGNYSLCFTVENEVFSQCNQVNISEPKDLSVYTTVNKTLNNINLQLDGGKNYTITINNNKYQTTQRDITLPLMNGVNKVTVTTDALCQGIIEKVITVNDRLVPYPNPFNSVLYVNVGNDNVRNVQVNIFGLTDGKPAHTASFTNKAGVLELNLSALPNGLYYLNLSLDGRTSGFKIIKK